MVWHRTDDVAFARIAQTGLQVPDQDLVKRKHGDRYGPGIYTTDGCALGCAKYGSVALLCLALAGSQREVATPAEAKCPLPSPLPSSVRTPSSVVYRHSAQVLAMARVEACPTMLQSARKILEQCVSLVTVRFPRLHFASAGFPWKLPGAPLTQEADVEACSRVLLDWSRGKPTGVKRRETELLHLYESDRFETRVISPEERVRLKSPWPPACDVWEIRTKCGLTVQVVLPPNYPFEAPHIVVVHPKVRPGGALVRAHGAVNFLPLNGVSLWSPALLMKDVLPRLTFAWDRGRAEGSLVVLGGGERYTAEESTLSVLNVLKRDSEAVALVPKPPQSQSSQDDIGEPGLGVDVNAMRAADAFRPYQDILDAFDRLEAEQGGGAGNGPCELARVETRGKLSRSELMTAVTDPEHVRLTILGLAYLEQIAPMVLSKNNGQGHLTNPGTHLLERVCGFTMHADRASAVVALLQAPALLLQAFRTARATTPLLREFFARAFDRRAHPCLEGRASLLVAFLERANAPTPLVSGTSYTEVLEPPLPTVSSHPQSLSRLAGVFLERCKQRWASAEGPGSGALLDAAWAGRGDQHLLAAFGQRFFNKERFLADLEADGLLHPRGPIAREDVEKTIKTLQDLGTF